MAEAGQVMQEQPAPPASNGGGKHIPFGSWGSLVTMLAFGVFFVLLFGAVTRGYLSGGPKVPVNWVDLGPETGFKIGELRVVEGEHVYVLPLQDGRLRALDGIVESSGCAVEWKPDDTRGAPLNFGGKPGAFVDPCSGLAWAITGDAIGHNRPLRTFAISRLEREGQPPHVQVEVLGDRTPKPREQN